MLYNNTDQKLLQKLYHGVNHKTDIVGKKITGKRARVGSIDLR